MGPSAKSTLISLTNRGLTPLEAIHAATTTAAELLDAQDQIGSLEHAKLADLSERP